MQCATAREYPAPGSGAGAGGTPNIRALCSFSQSFGLLVFRRKAGPCLLVKGKPRTWTFVLEAAVAARPERKPAWVFPVAADDVAAVAVDVDTPTADGL